MFETKLSYTAHTLIEIHIHLRHTNPKHLLVTVSSTSNFQQSSILHCYQSQTLIVSAPPSDLNPIVMLKRDKFDSIDVNVYGVVIFLYISVILLIFFSVSCSLIYHLLRTNMGRNCCHVLFNSFSNYNLANKFLIHCD